MSLVDTQTVESFHEEFMMFINKRKRVFTGYRQLISKNFAFSLKIGVIASRK